MVKYVQVLEKIGQRVPSSCSRVEMRLWIPLENEQSMYLLRDWLDISLMLGEIRPMFVAITAGMAGDYDLT